MKLNKIISTGFLTITALSCTQVFAQENSVMAPIKNQSTPIVMYVDNQVITADIDSSKTSADFLATLPRTMTMRRYDDRKYYGKFKQKLSETGKHIDSYSDGDVTYYPAGGSYAIFFAKQDVSQQSGLIKMGRISSDLSVFDKLDNTIEMRIELKK